ncbi:MAG: hypothetical protein KC442_12030 [Thermomicrobiales bacterium]|nr:hypothetical protein [Thermomicrobiales bacterium]
MSSTHPRLTRRFALAGAGASVVTLGLSESHTVAAQDATPDAMASHPLVGTWIVDPVTASPANTPAVANWGADGSFIDAGAGFTGAWEPTGARTALHSFVGILPDDAGYVVVSGEITVDESGDTFTQPYATTVFAPDGTILEQTTDNLTTARRFRPVPLAQMSTPLTAMPEWRPDSGTPTP